MQNKNIVHRYFKKELGDYTIIVQVDPETFMGLELIKHPDGKLEKTKMTFDEDIYEDLKVDEFEETNGLAFNLYLKGLA
ncbi:hypothetical protein FUAX_26810 [Fulvitalea axinellae]|uniref:DUF2283 domain-containing protein n=1 Tax=Fulvitalea axinellae TaxID=1182444 RepID=A0AAU9D6V8_9BACT|nr:hypothetical protein FUAX_26810 [Fulvitalea axinellae]